MIKKIDIPQSTAIDASVLWGGINDKVLAAKINEVVDAVNSLRDDCNLLMGYIAPEEYDPNTTKGLSSLVENSKTRAENVQKDTESGRENVQDKFAEQHKWIGKLCKFWDDDAFITSKDWAYGTLTSIDKGMQYQYCCNEISNFKHCEPVKPDDDIIFKGK